MWVEERNGCVNHGVGEKKWRSDLRVEETACGWRKEIGVEITEGRKGVAREKKKKKKELRQKKNLRKVFGFSHPLQKQKPPKKTHMKRT